MDPKSDATEAELYVPTPEKSTAPFARGGRVRGLAGAARPPSSAAATSSTTGAKGPRDGATRPVPLDKAMSTFKLSSRSFWPEPHVRVPADGYEDLRVDSEAVSAMSESGTFRVHTVTFNMHGKKKPPRDLRELLPVGQYHVYAVATQECLRAISTSLLRPSKKQWEDQLTTHFGRSYVRVAGHSLGAIHLCVFVLRQLLPLVGDIQSDAIATGLGNKLGNKGGVGVSFSLGQTSMAFISCHLSAHQHAVEQRNADYHRIEHNLRLCPADMDFETERVSDRFDRVFWLGDFNFRINGTRSMVNTLLAGNMHDVLQFNDQLRIERVAGRILAGFGEGPCNFRPTYKLDTGTMTYDTSKKHRIPSWTDRIFYRPMAAITLLQYDSLKTILTSDHLPVFASFEVQLRGAARKSGEVGESASIPVVRPVSPIGFLPGTPRTPEPAPAAPVPAAGGGHGGHPSNVNPSVVEAKEAESKEAADTSSVERAVGTVATAAAAANAAANTAATGDSNPSGSVLPALADGAAPRARSLPPLTGPMSPSTTPTLTSITSPVLAGPPLARSPLPVLGAAQPVLTSTPVRSSPLVRPRVIPASPDIAPDSEPIASLPQPAVTKKQPADMADGASAGGGGTDVAGGAAAADESSAGSSTASSSPAHSQLHVEHSDGGDGAAPASTAPTGPITAAAVAAAALGTPVAEPKERVASVVLDPHPVLPPRLRPRTAKPATVELGSGTSQVCSIM